MTMLSPAQKNFIDANFHENISEQDLSRDAFEQLQTPQELDYLARQYNWDTGLKLLQWIAQSPLCSQATAAEIFWLCQPQEFQQYKLSQALKNPENQQAFALIKTILQSFPAAYLHAPDLRFDPTPYLQQGLQIPSFMTEATQGEASYVYYDEDDVAGWFDSNWQAHIERADTSIELFNIAHFLDELEQAESILAHPLCDRGIATLVFWRLHKHCSIETRTPNMLRSIIACIETGAYPELLAYAPQEDSEVKIPASKAQWEIPPALKQAI